MYKGMKETWCKDDQFTRRLIIVINEEVYRIVKEEIKSGWYMDEEVHHISISMVLTSSVTLRNTLIKKLTRAQSEDSSTNILPEDFSLLYLLIQISIPNNIDWNIPLKGMRDKNSDCEHYFDTLCHTVMSQS